MKKTTEFPLSPPGMDRKPETWMLTLGWLFAILFHFSYYESLNSAIRSLYHFEYDGTKYLIPGAIMPDFRSVLGFAYIGFAVLSLCAPVFIFLRYRYFETESKSVYLMKRLSTPAERHIRCLLVPAIELIVCLLFAFLLLLADFGIYMLAVPDECLTPGQWQNLWSVL